MILVLLLVTATFRPAAPTVGDRILVTFPQNVRLDASPSYEIVSQKGRTATVRTFEPKAISLSGEAGGVRFRNLNIPVRSVLAPKDDMKPAPLKNPVADPMPRGPLITLAVAAFVAAALWAAVFARARRRTAATIIEPELPAVDRFRGTVLALISDERAPNRWARLADATRHYLATLTPYLGAELTSTQLLARIDAEHLGTVSDILRRGDAEKFSPWGAPHGDFTAIATRALSLIPPPPPQEQAAA